MTDRERNQLIQAVLEAVQKQMTEHRMIGPVQLEQIGEQFMAPIRPAIV